MLISCTIYWSWHSKSTNIFHIFIWSTLFNIYFFTNKRTVIRFLNFYLLSRCQYQLYVSFIISWRYLTFYSDYDNQQGSTEQYNHARLVCVFCFSFGFLGFLFGFGFFCSVLFFNFFLGGCVYLFLWYKLIDFCSWTLIYLRRGVCIFQSYRVRHL